MKYVSEHKNLYCASRPFDSSGVPFSLMYIFQFDVHIAWILFYFYMVFSCDVWVSFIYFLIFC